MLHVSLGDVSQNAWVQNKEEGGMLYFWVLFFYEYHHHLVGDAVPLSGELNVCFVCLFCCISLRESFVYVLTSLSVPGPQIKEEVESTELAMAFCLSDAASSSSSSSDIPLQPRQQSVFAFLPLRSFGFRFIIQGQRSQWRAEVTHIGQASA